MAEDAFELAKIKGSFYGQQLGGVPDVDVGNLEDFEGEESLKPSVPKVINTESTTQVKEHNVVEPKPGGVSDEQFILWESARNDASVVKVPSSGSTPNQPVIPALSRKESSLNANVVPYVQNSVPKQGYMSNDPCFPVSTSESMVSRLTTSSNQLLWLSMRIL